MKHTKIVATIGPASEKVDTLVSMIKSGFNVARLNFSHGSHEEHLNRVNAVRAASKRTNVPITLLQDLSGPKIRIGDFATDTVTLLAGASFIITTDAVVGSADRVSLTHKELPAYVKKGSRILLNDGKNELVVEKVLGNDIYTKVVVGGVIKGRRGVNVPGAYLPIRSLTPKDIQDVQFGLKHGVDFFAVSFVRTASDIQDLRTILDKHKSKAQIIAKVETQEAVDNMEAIVVAADGVMVARGDLAVEIPAQQVPLVQKRLIEMCRLHCRPVIVATHMMESMLTSPSPTRAEVSDVANAVLDGTDAVMLSAESALGAYPVQAVATMAAIAEEAEKGRMTRPLTSPSTKSTTDTVTEAVVHAAQRSQAKAIVALTESGETARLISRYRPEQPILCITPHDAVMRQLVLSYGCIVEKSPLLGSLDSVLKRVKTLLKKDWLAKQGDSFVLAAGIPFGKSGGTNTVMVQKVS